MKYLLLSILFLSGCYAHYDNQRYQIDHNRYLQLKDIDKKCNQALLDYDKIISNSNDERAGYFLLRKQNYQLNCAIVKAKINADANEVIQHINDRELVHRQTDKIIWQNSFK